jgi:hypothetical protein
MKNAFSDEFYQKPKIAETCTKNLETLLSAYESFMGPCIDLIYEFSSLAMNNLREEAEFNRRETIENYEFKPLQRDELIDYFLFECANMIFKNKDSSQVKFLI